MNRSNVNPRILLIIVLSAVIGLAVLLLFLLMGMKPGPCPVPPSPRPDPSREPQYNQVIHLKGQMLSNDLIQGSYQFPRDYPSENPQNWVGVWEGDSFRAGQPTEVVKKVPANSEKGDLFFDKLNLEDTDYVVGLGVGPEGADLMVSEVVSTVSFGENQQLKTPGRQEGSCIQILETGAKYLFFRLTRPVPAKQQKIDFVFIITPTQKPGKSICDPRKKDFSVPFIGPLILDETVTNTYIVPSEDVLEVTQELYLIKNFSTRQKEWYALQLYIQGTDGVNYWASSCIFQADHQKKRINF